MFKRSLVFGKNTPETVNMVIACAKESCEVVGDNGLEKRVEILESNETEVLYFEQVSSATGTVTIPSGASIQLDQFPGGADAFVNTYSGGQPTGNFPTDTNGTVIDVATFDSAGNYTLTGNPSSYPVAIIYVVKISEINKSNLNLSNVLEYWETKLDSYEFNIPVPTTTWVVLHNLGYEPEVQALLTNGEEIEGLLTHNSLNQFTITFNSAYAGKVKYK